MEKWNYKIDNSIFIFISIYALFFSLNESIAITTSRVAIVLGFLKLVLNYNIVYSSETIKKYLNPVYGLFLVMAFMVFFSTNIRVSVLAYENLIKEFIPFFVVIFFIDNKKYLLSIFMFAMIGFFLNNIIGIFKYFKIEETRMSGLDGDVISFAGFLILYMVILIILWIKIKKYRIGISILICILLVALILNSTRIAWIILIIDLIAIILIFTKGWRKKTIAFLCVFISLGIIYNINDTVNKRINTLFDSNYISNIGHYHYAKDGLSLFIDNKLTGVGLNCFREEMVRGDYISNESKQNLDIEGKIIIDGKKVMPHAHNNTIMFLAETGLIGTVAVWALFISWLIYIWKDWKYLNDFIPLIFFFVTINFLLQGITDYNINLKMVFMHYLFLMGIGIKYISIEKNSNSPRKGGGLACIMYESIIFSIAFRVIVRNIIT